MSQDSHFVACTNGRIAIAPALNSRSCWINSGRTMQNVLRRRRRCHPMSNYCDNSLNYWELRDVAEVIEWGQCRELHRYLCWALFIGDAACSPPLLWPLVILCVLNRSAAIVLTVGLHDFLPAEFKFAVVEVLVRLEDNEHRRAGWGVFFFFKPQKVAAQRFDQFRAGAGAVVQFQAVVSTVFLVFYFQFRECDFYHLQQNRAIISRKKNVTWERHRPTRILHFNTVVPEDSRCKTRKLAKISCRLFHYLIWSRV